jgi:SAM-dependent methyltransferase
VPREQAASLLETYLNEAVVGYGLASRVVRPGARVLEVGSGLGFVSLFLRSIGYDVVALDPVGTGFDFFSAARDVVRKAVSEVDLDLLPIGIEALDRDEHGTFDAMFSVHVLEHVPDLPAAFGAMARALAPGGEAVHVCPNYHVPYEPHVGIPLLPFAPQRTSRMFARQVAAHEDVWASLNFVTSTDVRRLARANDLAVMFDRGVLYDFVHRLDEDPVFASRHDTTAIRTVRALDRRGLLAPLRRIPPAAATPMTFTLRHAHGNRGAGSDES